jgi:mycofactocin precursor
MVLRVLIPAQPNGAMTAGSMVTGIAPPHTVTNIGCRRPPQVSPPATTVAATKGAQQRRLLMHQDTRADQSIADGSSRSTDVTSDDTGDGPGISEELLVEEVSIDGMCGVY